jgi:hypothetical protein
MVSRPSDDGTLVPKYVGLDTYSDMYFMIRTSLYRVGTNY